MSEYTVKQLTSEFKVSRQAINQFMNKEFREKYVNKVGNRLSIDEKGYAILYHHFMNKPYKVKKSGVKYKKDVNDSSIDNVELVNQLKVKDKQMLYKDKQIEKLQTLLDQQQKLTLQANKQIESMSTDIKSLQKNVNDSSIDKNVDNEKSKVSSSVDDDNNEMVTTPKVEKKKKHWWNFFN